ncbi:hypothetical protein [Candidatus Viadribacter manganicus]|uniref:Uncharacterized protein n=1 Tax=Candidatus Viadribacter manganicus TaxID=1759059 RepID=A0A1B1AMG5_9PROT|nr:hypothetical protein [Candidatus Viadribacter manganicus]ANP47768.1 hypothetical protein ATE48_18635 [Candidatus Viadribacter manganicus]
MGERSTLIYNLTAERLRRKADDVIHEAETTASRNARERLRDAAARMLEAANYVEAAYGA